MAADVAATIAKPVPPKKKALVPRDAATLLVLDRTLSGVHVLMGKRRDDLAFNPGAYVFPGGRVDPTDGFVSADVDMPDRLRDRLLDRMRPKPSRRRARALLVAALRETAEETGYLIGRRDGGFAKAPPDGFQPFVDKAVGLDLATPVLIGRAITPVKRPRRFDARFFAVWADDAVAVVPESPVPPDNELSDVRFVPLEETGRLDLPRMTKIMLAELDTRLAADPRLTLDLPAPFFVPFGEKHRRDEI
ncbi:NUDIX hydrolase [Mongoliimonas terrestris]|uniref:NUDIX hydrolase n=1 Tax=Mongoliimonas terrestris TaxID=1709001 RepID=UPI00094974EE|nr:NUDIX domain-containing protein [Mongoliimonas terrestris]